MKIMYKTKKKPKPKNKTEIPKLEIPSYLNPDIPTLNLPLYLIGCLSPGKGLAGSDLNDFPFLVKTRFLAYALNTELTRKRLEDMQERGFEIFQCFPNFKEKGYLTVTAPYTFYPMTFFTRYQEKNGVIYSCLLKSCRVPSLHYGPENECSLELKLDEIYPEVETFKEIKKLYLPYEPRNVEDTDQATALAVLFFNWINILEH